MRPGFDAPVIAIDCGVDADRGIGITARFILGREQFDLVAQRCHDCLQGQNVIGLFVDDLAGSMILRAMSRWHPMVSMVTTAPSIAGMSRRAGMATISLDVPLTLVCARTRRCRAAKADTIRIAPLPLLLPERREVFPLMAMTSGAALTGRRPRP
jgi:hypothetical protein